MMNRPDYDLGFIRVNAQHRDFLHSHLLQLLQKPPRETPAGPYYKLHGHWFCICLTPQEAAVTLAALTMMG